MSDRPQDDTLELLELVLAEARRYLPALDGDPVRPQGADDAARAFTAPLPEGGLGSV